VQNLAANAQKTLTLSWNTKAVSFGGYTIVATANLASDMNTANNELASDEVVAVKADIRPFPIEMILGVVVVVGGIIAALAIYNARRKKKRKPE
jgi:beta-lactamase regulating signal transducer with metallopeptidase domain